MAAEDFDGFYSNFLPQFLSSCEGLDDNQKSILAGNFKVDKVRGVYRSNIINVYLFEGGVILLPFKLILKLLLP